MKAVFIIGSGRSGTYALYKAFEQSPGLCAQHEFAFEQMLKMGVRRFLGKAGREEAMALLRQQYLPAVKAAGDRCWLDCSNALPWWIDLLAEALPDARFILMTRHGKRVVSSFFHKFPETLYADDCVDALYGYLLGDQAEPEALKAYWRPVPLPGNTDYEWFRQTDRFGRLCYYWKCIHEEAIRQLEKLPANRFQIMAFEDVLESATTREQLCHYFPDADLAAKILGEALVRPVNVAQPVHYALSQEQEISFSSICDPMMQRLGYDPRTDYAVDYHPAPKAGSRLL